MNISEIKTKRLILRKFTENDIEALYILLKDEEVNTFLPWFPVKNLDEARNFYEKRYAVSYQKSGAYKYAVCLKSDNLPIGYVHINMDESHDLGYALRKEFWNRGIVTEACKAVIEQLKKDGIPYITATHDVQNPRSGRVMQKLGMKYQYSYEEQVHPKNHLVTFRMYLLNLDGNSSRVFRKYWDISRVRYIEAL